MVIRKQCQKNVRILEQYYIIHYTADVSTVFFFFKQGSEFPFSKTCLLATFSCKMVAKKNHINGSTLHVVSPAFVCLIIWPNSHIFIDFYFQICWLPIGDFCQNFSHLMYFSLAMVIKVVVTWSTDILSWLLALTTQLPMSRVKFCIIRVSLFTKLRMYSWLYIIFSCFYSSYKNSNWLTCFI